MAVNVGEVYAVLGLDKSSFDSSLTAAESRFDSFGSSLVRKAGSIAKATGAALVIGAGVFAAVATAGTKAYADVESAAADAASKMDLSAIAQSSGKSMEQSFDGVKQHVIDLSRELGQLSTNSFDPTQIASAMANLAAGGFDVASASAKDLAPILSLATASNYDLKSSAEVAMSTMNQYGMSVSNLGHISDVFTTASGKSAAGMSDFKTAMAYVGPAAQNANVSLEESIAMLSKLRDVGIPAEMTGTALRDGMQTLVAKTPVFTKALESIGLKTSDVDLRSNKFIDSLVKMKVQADKTGDGAKYFNDMFGVTGDTLYNLAGMAPGVNTLTTSLENCNGASEQMAGLMNNTLKGAFNTAMGSAIDLGIGIGEKLAPSLEKLFKWFSNEAAPAISKFIDAVANGDWDSVGEMITSAFETAFNYIEEVGSKVWDSIKEPAITACEMIAGAAGIGLVVVGLASYGPLLLTVGKSFATMAITGVLSFAKVAAAATGSAIVSGITSIVGFTSMAAKGFLTVGIAATSAFLKAKIAAVSSYASMVAASITAKLAFLSTWAAALGPIAGVVAGIALISAGLGTIGYALDPGKFTTFNKVAKDAFTGLKSVVTDCFGLILKGDFSGVATRLKEAFTNSITYIKEINWQGLGSDIINMVADGATAIINTVLDIGGKIYDSLSAWISSGGPEQLGYDIASFISSGLESIGTYDIWSTVESIFGTVADWLSLGWDIVSGIGRGILDKIYEKLQPVGHSMVTTFVTTSLTIQRTFAQLWNTIVVEAALAVTNITNAFSSIGTTIAGYFEPVTNAISRLSGVSPIGYQSDTGARKTPEQYAAMKSGKYKDRYDPIYASDAAIDTVKDYIKPASSTYKFEENPTVGSPISGKNSLGTNTDWSVLESLKTFYGGLTTGNWDMGSGGYRTGGKGFTTSEMQPAGSGYVNATTDRGDKMTLSGNEVIPVKVMDMIGPWTADYKTDEGIKAEAKAQADAIFPVLDITKKSNEDSVKTAKKNAAITTQAAKTFESDITQTAITESAKIKSMSDFYGNYAASSANANANALKDSSTYISGSYNTASKNALAISASVCSNFSSGGNAVKIGMTESGRQIAVIGSVAAKQFEAGGNKLVDGSTSAKDSLTQGGTSLNTSAVTGGKSIETSCINGASAISNVLKNDIGSRNSNMVNKNYETINNGVQQKYNYRDPFDYTYLYNDINTYSTNFKNSNKQNSINYTPNNNLGSSFGDVKINNNPQPSLFYGSGSSEGLISNASENPKWVSDQWAGDYNDAYTISMNASKFKSKAKGDTVPIIETNTQNKLKNPWTDEDIYTLNRASDSNKQLTKSTKESTSGVYELSSGVYQVKNDMGGLCEAISPFGIQQESMTGLFKEQSIIIKDSLTPAQREAYRNTQNLASATAEYGGMCEANTKFTLDQENALGKVSTSFIGATATYNALGLGASKATVQIGSTSNNIVQLGSDSQKFGVQVGSFSGGIKTLGTNVESVGVQIGQMNTGLTNLVGTTTKGTYSFGQAVNTWNGIISESAIQAAQEFISKQKFDLSGGNKNEYGEIDYGTDAVINSLVKLTAENGKFCEAMSDFGLAQENTIGLFQQSYIGPTSGYSNFKELDAAIALLAGQNTISANINQQENIQNANNMIKNADNNQKINLNTMSTYRDINTNSLNTYAIINKESLFTNNFINTANKNSFDYASNSIKQSTLTQKTASDDTTSSMNKVNSGLQDTVAKIGDVNTKLSETVTAVSTTNAQIASSASNILGLANRGGSEGYGAGSWGGTSISGMGGWVGTGASYSGWGAQLSDFVSGGNSSGSYGSFSWGARGGLFENGPEIIGVGEKGRELVLPSDITNTLITLTDMGLNRLKDNSKSISVQLPVNNIEKIFNKNSETVSKKEVSKAMNFTLILEMNGKQMAREVMPFMFNDVTRAGLKLKH